jgi:tetratricopeptide (TPR) repeat protein
VADFHGDKDRKVIPRWRPFRATLHSGELGNARDAKERRPLSTKSHLDARRREWLENRTLSFAADFVSSAVSLGEPQEAADAAQYIKQQEKAPVSAVRVADAALSPATVATSSSSDVFDLEHVYVEIHDLRVRLHDEPRNCFLWSDIAHLYSTLGLNEKAERAIEMSLVLGGNNRHILRAATRFFIHIGAAKRAHDLLRRNERAAHDPWLMAAEIATAGAAHQGPKFARAGRKTLEAEKLSPFHTSELASALATLDLEGGGTKRARQFFRQSLVSPTENSVAQAAWAARRFVGIDVDGTTLRTSSEAKAWENMKGVNWQRAVAAARAWLADQPFSSRPATLGSYVASVAIGDDQLSARFAEHGVTANPQDFTLRNNLAVSYARLGRINEAAQLLERVESQNLKPVDQLVFIATHGLLHFRSGFPTEGRVLYDEAIRRAELLHETKRAALARILLAMEELRVGSREGEALKARALEEGKKLDEPEFVPLLARLKGAIADQAEVRPRAPSPLPRVPLM